MHIIQLGWLKGVPIPVKGYGGIERVHHTLSRELARQGHTVTVIAPPSSTVEGCEVIECNDFTKATEIIRGLKADIVHDHSCWSLESPVRQSLEIPTISTTHVNDSIGYSRNVVYMSKAQREKHATQLGKDLTYSPVIPCPIDPQLKPRNLPRQDYLLYIGAIVEHKGVREAAVVAQRLNRKLIVAGEFTSDNKYAAEISNMPNVQMVGVVSGFFKETLIEQAYAVMLLVNGYNNWVESGCGVVGEAFVFNTPVAAFPNGCLQELVATEFNGWLADDVDEMVHMMKYRHYPSRMATTAKTLNVKFIVGQYVDLYQRVIQGESWD